MPVMSPSQPQEELHPKGKEVSILVLDAFAKLQKATFVGCVFSARPYRTTRLPLDGFL